MPKFRTAHVAHNIFSLYFSDYCSFSPLRSSCAICKLHLSCAFLYTSTTTTILVLLLLRRLNRVCMCTYIHLFLHCIAPFCYVYLPSILWWVSLNGKSCILWTLANSFSSLFPSLVLSFLLFLFFNRGLVGMRWDDWYKLGTSGTQWVLCLHPSRSRFQWRWCGWKLKSRKTSPGRCAITSVKC